MASRPRREVKPTKPFEYEDRTALSTASGPQTVTRKKKVVRIKREAGGDNKTRRVLVPGGHSRHNGIEKTNQYEHSEPSEGFFGNTFADRATDVVFDFDNLDSSDAEYHENSSNSGRISPRRNPRKLVARNSKRCLLDDAKTLQKSEEQVIEQWYADPYERIDPEQPAYDEWRRRQLQARVLEQGFNLKASKEISNWLMRCNGRFQPMGIVKKRGKRIRQGKRRRKEKKSVDFEKINSDNQISLENDLTRPAPASSENTLSLTCAVNESSDESADQDSDSDGSTSGSMLVTSKSSAKHIEGYTETIGAPSSNPVDELHIRHSESINGSGFGDEEEQEPAVGCDWSSLSDEMKIAVLRHRLNIFQIVYGEEKLESAKNDFDINYVSPVTLAPKSVPISGLQTQGHLRLKQVAISETSPALSNHLIQPNAYGSLQKALPNHGLNHNQSSLYKPEVFTEDPAFGMTVIPTKQRATAEDLKFYYAQLKRSRDRDNNTSGNIGDSLASRAEEAENNEEERQDVLAQLKQKHFNWETPDSMKGLWVRDIYKSDGNPETTFQNKFYYFGEDPVYLEIRQRQKILAEGGERAMRLIEDDLEIERREVLRERRRIEVAKSRAKREAIDLGVGDGHAKKCVRLSGWSVDD